MSDSPSLQPRSVHQVMVSSTFTDLQEHRAALIKVIHKHGLHASAMENDDAKPAGDVIDSSLQMVRDSAAYIGVISMKYGQTPVCEQRNPDQLSITELEFLEAQRLKRPILLYIMGDDHLVKRTDIEMDPTKIKKLNAFRERAKKASPDSAVNRVYAVFNSLEEFKDKVGSSLNKLEKLLAKQTEASATPTAYAAPSDKPEDDIPRPPAFYAEPDYIGSHQFVGRRSELEILDDWAAPADPTNLLLFEAIGGNGKSMLTWEWTTKHATTVRDDWAGQFWYSFYEKGAVMSDFCRRALAYMTGQPLKTYGKKRTAQLKDELLAQLHAKPWLIILDGLERVLVAYHRIDAAELRDEEVNNPTDKIADRDPCDAIRDEDNDLLRALAAAVPSKIVVSTRLTPRVLLNPSNQPIPGVHRETLKGLRPPDAEKLLRSCGIEGNGAAIQKYLQANCDNHPLVIGILGGLIYNYLPARGDFDRWLTDPTGGAKLDMGKLDLIQRRNHILEAAIGALPAASRQLLSTLALLSESVDYETLRAFNPHIFNKDAEGGTTVVEETEITIQQLMKTVGDLEKRGLLQYDHALRHHDLHPVVRGVASSRMREEKKQYYGQRVVDHFSSLAHSPYEEAETLDDLRPALNVVSTLLKLGRYQQAADVYSGDLALSLLYNLEGHLETLSLLEPFFMHGWNTLPSGIEVSDASYLTSCRANALYNIGEKKLAYDLYCTFLRDYLNREDFTGARTTLFNISACISGQNSLSNALRILNLSKELAALNGDIQGVFVILIDLHEATSLIGDWKSLDAISKPLDASEPIMSRALYRPGNKERMYLRGKYWKGELTESDFSFAFSKAGEGKNRTGIRGLFKLRGLWWLDQKKWHEAKEDLAESLRMARERSLPAAGSETGLALAKFHLGELTKPRQEAERLSLLRKPSHYRLAQLWLAIGDLEKAKYHALAAYEWAWADGEPYVRRFDLTQATTLLEEMNVPLPDLPVYDPAKDVPFEWEADVRAVIKKLRKEKKEKGE